MENIHTILFSYEPLELEIETKEYHLKTLTNEQDFVISLGELGLDKNLEDEDIHFIKVTSGGNLHFLKMLASILKSKNDVHFKELFCKYI